jgi:hypothetical protein
MRPTSTECALSGCRRFPMPTFYTMTVDTEEEWHWNTGWPTRHLALENIRHLPRFQDLCERHGVATTYFTNQAVLDDAEAGRTLLEVAGRKRVEIGMHIHPWNTPPYDADQPVRARDTFVHNLPAEMVLAKLDNVYQRFLDNGLQPTSFRGGRYSCGPIVQNYLRDKGFVADSSVVPFMTWKDDGAPDHRSRDLSPVRLPPRRAGERPFWEIPLTLGFTRRPFRFWQRAFDRIENSWLSKLRLIGIAERLGIVRRIWLNFEQPLGRNMLPLLRKLRGMRLSCILLTVHSSSLMAGKNEFTPTKADEDRLFAYMDEVFGALAQWPEFQPATISEVALKLEEAHHAGPGN